MTQAELQELLFYDPKVGEWIWLRGRRRGRLAGFIRRADGYRIIGNVMGKNRKSSRLAWLYMTGYWPDYDIDHINGDKADDRWRNLRAATVTQNIANSRIRKDNKSGLKGVHLRGGRWWAQIQCDGKKRHLGCFDTAEAASVAYLAEARVLFGGYARER